MSGAGWRMALERRPARNRPWNGPVRGALIALAILPCLAHRSEAALSDSNVVWTSPSKGSDGSMPLGNGDLGLNVWAEQDGSVAFYIGKTDAWDEHGRLLKLGRVRLRLTPNPFSASAFRQELRLAEGEVVISASRDRARAEIRLWVDALRPVIHAELVSDHPLNVEASLELWRTGERKLLEGETMGVDGFAPDDPPRSYPDVVREDAQQSILWYHRNRASLWPVTLRHQGLGEHIDPARDPLLHRTFGGQLCLYPDTGRVVKPGPTVLRTTEGVRNCHVRITCLTTLAESEEAWLSQLRQLRARSESAPLDAIRDSHRDWWRRFWDRSWLRVTRVRGARPMRARPMRQNTLPLRIGADSAGGNRFHGAIAEVRLYGRALSRAELKDEAAGGAWKQGIIARWSLGGLKGEEVPSYGPEGPRLRAIGGPSVAPQAPWPDGRSIVLTGKEYLEAAHSASLDLTNEVTISAWIRPDRLPPGGARIVDKTHAGDSDGYLLDTYPGNSLRLIVADGPLQYDAKLPTDRFTHVAGVFDARTGRKELYINGRRVATGSGEDDGRSEAQIVTQGYALQRFITACGGRGGYPIKFNGSIFTVDTDRRFDPDYRAWGGMYWFQNTRLPYWPMAAAGDYEMMLPLFRMYRDALDLAAYRTARYFRHGGAYFPETMYFWGAYNNGLMGYGWDRAGKPLFPCDNQYIRYYWSGGLELTALMLTYWDHTRDLRYLKDTLLPIADAVVAFYDQHYRRDASGKLLLEPSQALETYWDCVNPLPDIAGLRFVLENLLTLPGQTTGRVRTESWRRLLGELPELPLRSTPKGRALAAAAKVGRKSNIENPELYAVFPYRIYGVGKPGLDLARRTYAVRTEPGHRGWQQDDIQAAFLGLADEARSAVTDRLSRKHEGSRFPAFWGPNFDWVPDQDHGSNGLMALQTMLMQCEGRRILLLPAWPADWDAEFKLHAPFRTTVQGRIRNGRIENLVVSPASRRRDVEIVPRATTSRTRP